MSKKTHKESAYQFGIWAEYCVILILWIKGFRIIARRYKTKVGEIDIVASKKNIVAFIEVKARKDTHAKEVVSKTQQARICRAAMLFIAKKKKFANLNKRFDLVIVVPWSWPRYIPNAWEYLE